MNSDALTPRQRQMMELLAAGYSQKQAAKMLGISYSTLRKHALAARRRANCASLVELAFVLAQSPADDCNK